MRWKKKPLVQRKCNFCSKIVLVTNKRAKRFKFCSNKCKHEVWRQNTNPTKTPQHKLIYVKCRSVFCNKGKFYKVWRLKITPVPFCSKACFYYSRTKKYKLDIAAIQEVKQEEIKQSIWGRF